MIVVSPTQAIAFDRMERTIPRIERKLKRKLDPCYAWMICMKLARNERKFDSIEAFRE